MRPTILLSVAVTIAGCTLLFGNDLDKKNDGSNGGSGGGPARMTIGAAGGTATSADGQASVVIPTGALSTDVPITVVPWPLSIPGTLGQTYEVQPTGTTFNLPVRITINQPSAPPEGMGFVMKTEDVAGKTEFLPTIVKPDPAMPSVSGYTLHLSQFAVVVQKTEAPSCDCNSTCLTKCCSFPNMPTSTCSCVFQPLQWGVIAYAMMFWAAWDCYDQCEGAFGPEKTTPCTPCVSHCYKNASAVIDIAKPGVCAASFVASNAEFSGLDACLQDCHAKDQDQATAICPGSPCGTPHCGISLTGAVNASYSCSCGGLIWQRDQSGVFHPSFMLCNPLLSLTQTTTSGTATFAALTAPPDPGMYPATISIYDQDQNGNISNYESTSAGTLNLTCVKPSLPASTALIPNAGSLTGTMTGARGTINFAAEFVQ